MLACRFPDETILLDPDFDDEEGSLWRVNAEIAAYGSIAEGALVRSRPDHGEVYRRHVLRFHRDYERGQLAAALRVKWRLESDLRIAEASRLGNKLLSRYRSLFERARGVSYSERCVFYEIKARGASPWSVTREWAVSFRNSMAEHDRFLEGVGARAGGKIVWLIEPRLNAGFNAYTSIHSTAIHSIHGFI